MKMEPMWASLYEDNGCPYIEVRIRDGAVEQTVAIRLEGLADYLVVPPEHRPMTPADYLDHVAQLDHEALDHLARRPREKIVGWEIEISSLSAPRWITLRGGAEGGAAFYCLDFEAAGYAWSLCLHQAINLFDGLVVEAYN